MLVLSRKAGESIEIGDQEVIVHVLATRGSRVQLGIDAPPQVAIHRSERGAREKGAGEKGARGVNRAVADGQAPGRKDRDSRHQQRPLSETSSPSGASPFGASSFGDGLLQDLTLAQTEIATLAEMATESDRAMARQIAAKAVERLTAIERTLRVLTRQTFERPIAAFVESRSDRLQQNTRTDEQVAKAASVEEAQRRDVKPPATLAREPASDYRLLPLS